MSAIGAALESGDRSAILGAAEPTGLSYSKVTLAKVLEKALTKHPEATDKKRSELDSDLAARLHFVLRLSRNSAADPGLWAWLALGPAWNYTAHRWPWEPGDTTWRYSSTDMLRNGVSRLWWGAEMVRSGPNYDLVPAAFTTVRAFQNVSELRYSMHRECARAFTRVLSTYKYNGDELSKLFNAYLRTHSLEVFDTDYGPKEKESGDAQWMSYQPTSEEAAGPVGSLVGPDAGYSRSKVEDRLLAWLAELYEELAKA